MSVVVALVAASRTASVSIRRPAFVDLANIGRRQRGHDQLTAFCTFEEALLFEDPKHLTKGRSRDSKFTRQASFGHLRSRTDTAVQHPVLDEPVGLVGKALSSLRSAERGRQHWHGLSIIACRAPSLLVAS